MSSVYNKSDLANSFGGDCTFKEHYIHISSCNINKGTKDVALRVPLQERHRLVLQVRV